MKLVTKLPLPNGVLTVIAWNINTEKALDVAKTIVEYYRRVNESPEYLELHVYSDYRLLENTLHGEAVKRGVSIHAIYDLVFEAWTGVPRIHVVYSKKPPPKPLLLHEATHAILHGSLEYYMPPCTGDPLALHTAATAIKDLEVTLYMAAKGFRKEAEEAANAAKPEKCNGPADLLDTLRYTAMTTALNNCKPPATTACNLAKTVTELTRICREANKTRPWTRVCTLASTLEEEMKHKGWLSP